MVESELKKDPDISNRELREKAVAIDRKVNDLSARQFNATYPLQVKRSMAPKKPRRRRPTTRKARTTTTRRTASRDGNGRDKVRGVLLELARDVANAQGKGDVVDVIAGIDRYVDRVVRAAT
ncbi:MAG TPA: hypothetical protein VK966_06760 [Longimicrobiales bacterium]|nr:hypothetical protein [Longimicrobiales bacterium]